MDQPYETKTITRDIPTEFTVKYFADYDADISYMGHFSQNWSPGAIDRELANDDYSIGEYRYWIPTPGCSDWEDYQRETRQWYQEHGYSRHESAIAAHQHKAQDFRRVQGLNRGDWHFIGIVVESAWGNESLWGIESDLHEDYLQEIIDDLVYELLEQTSITVKIR